MVKPIVKLTTKGNKEARRREKREFRSFQD